MLVLLFSLLSETTLNSGSYLSMKAEIASLIQYQQIL